MQHNRAGRKLGRTSAHRKALFRNQLDSLILHERIQTTISKAKELRPLAEKLVTLARRGGLHARRLALRDISQEAAKRLFDEIAPRFATRPGGYTRILKLGQRPGDAAEKAIIEFVDFDYAQRRAEKKAAEKAVTEKKESLLEKARRLVTGKGGEKDGAKADEGAEAAKADEKKAEKKAAAPKAAKPAKTAAPKAPKPKTEKKGGSTPRTPRKAGGA
ncbi:MAG TPA: 50S ribosomal protein L17 [Thermoanaerobaculia bacterium]|jgi:large subunit ribosomal protein L17|nr:50S ribosomal protein L17 [Thermoanaerobaculia bacterium]HPA51735.1 50S ribosomal protein L17 [Thermoanaerobaculia bacterium]HQN06860.1 50S ribosomal protein L17 [Thermoanaerobaculia bacterium]HQP87951.1 50S ribosomal protein L17 [Thermoanaerobaculia bacterium]